jgi:diguanylate cyclase (GGDEF)-like protein
MDKMKVLIIEDDKDTAVFFRTVLSLVGFECEIILSAKEALARLAAGTPELILLDIRLGLEISGEDILYQIRSNPRFDNTRVIIITAYPRMAEPITDLADLILLKPVDVEQLKSLVQRVGDFEFRPKYHLFRDPVTELFNEEFFLTRLDLASERAKRRSDFHFAVIVFRLQLDAQQEEQIQPETLLSILHEVGQRLRSHLRPTDAIARISGWKFATLHEDLNEAEDVEIIIARLVEILAEPYQVEGELYPLTISFGSVVHDLHYTRPHDILEAAEKALEKARSSGS